MNTPASIIPALRVAETDDIDLVADIVAEAFEDLDVIRFLVPQQTRRWSVSRAWYRLYIAHAIGGAGQVVVTEDHSAAAVWFDRTRPFTEPDQYSEQLVKLAGDALPRFRHLDAQMDAHHPTDPHWHLLFLAVRPPRQNHGLGARLLAHTHARLDADGIPAYLEATSPQNQRLYHRHGYTDMTPPTIEITDSIPLYRMWRPAGTD
ncbi:GNAT family N-acetyltransferase [Paractinoplanes brasiliensis]|uniref:Acetyltransferase (GNAT) family protein n=1 Tax=Paractinoplanes brasiliensis TaxID=52695 RepID=A0A4R6JUA7_9ACTN|nr:GNAT family N-acetyltransferase [Actinoplanes brasiliensis]TDO38235.1 acetyltransferase (GNAT) family protein [Actinoplanes brasiliensis]GID26988.1 N-acetyltransferase [Actinoplanes brasiliensis]